MPCAVDTPLFSRRIRHLPMRPRDLSLWVMPETLDGFMEVTLDVNGRFLASCVVAPREDQWGYVHAWVTETVNRRC